MKLIYTAPNPMLVSHAANLLESAGIELERRHLFLGGGAGDLPLNEVWPEIWVAEAEGERAQKLLQTLQHPDAAPGWRCRHCGERCEAPFSHCWRCGEPRDDE